MVLNTVILPKILPSWDITQNKVIFLFVFFVTMKKIRAIFVWDLFITTGFVCPHFDKPNRWFNTKTFKKVELFPSRSIIYFQCHMRTITVQRLSSFNTLLMFQWYFLQENIGWRSSCCILPTTMINTSHFKLSLPTLQCLKLPSQIISFHGP
jgi:hypothetical protein